MAPSLITLLAFVALVIGLLIVIVGYRSAMIATNQTPANSWTRGNAQWNNPGFITRAEHAHANCLEMLPLLGAVILVSAVTDQLTVTDGLAYWFLGARVGQVVTHILSASAGFVIVRASFFAVQLVILVIWILQLSGLL